MFLRIICLFEIFNKSIKVIKSKIFVRYLRKTPTNHKLSSYSIEIKSDISNPDSHLTFVIFLLFVSLTINNLLFDLSRNPFTSAQSRSCNLIISSLEFLDTVRRRFKCLRKSIFVLKSLNLLLQMIDSLQVTSILEHKLSVFFSQTASLYLKLWALVFHLFLKRLKQLPYLLSRDLIIFLSLFLVLTKSLTHFHVLLLQFQAILCHIAQFIS